LPELGVTGHFQKGHLERRKEEKGKQTFKPSLRKEAKRHFNRFGRAALKEIPYYPACWMTEKSSGEQIRPA
jgi:hypothetical protein